MKKQNFLPSPERRMLTIEEAADYCGLSPNSFRAYIRISPTNFGRSVRYDRVAIDKFIDEMTAPNESPRVNRILELAGKKRD
jgi:predicted DNA-binding transcriptional regulator AlpA